jgi:hypothetical protein
MYTHFISLLVSYVTTLSVANYVGPMDERQMAREQAWKAIADRLQRPYYLSRVDHDRKIRSGKQKTDIGKYSFVNRTIQQMF